MKSHFLKLDVLIVLGGYLFLFVLSALALMFNVNIMNVLDSLPQVCPFRRMTGLLCPGCGLTHAFFCLSQFRVREAMAYHPFSPVLFLGGISWIILPERQRLMPKGSLMIILGLMILVFWVVRNLA